MNFAEILKTQRKEMKLTQEDLADKLLVSSKTISNWETGKTTPDIDNVIRISNLFDISLNTLLSEGSEMVEGIKRKAEIRETKIYLICSSITNAVFLFIVATEPIFGDLPLIFSFSIAIGACVNSACVLYFSKRYNNLSGKNWNKKTKQKKIWTIIYSSIVIIALISLIIFIRFKL